MLELILLSPLLLVIVAATAIRFVLLRRPFRGPGCAILLTCAAIAFTLPLGWGAWVPDLLFAPHRTLAATTSPSGISFRVVQYWNRFDFYSTELHISPPTTSTEIVTLDGDDNKSWSVPLAVNESSRVATVTLSGGRSKSVHW
jgi:hypothetical protein